LDLSSSVRRVGEAQGNVSKSPWRRQRKSAPDRFRVRRDNWDHGFKNTIETGMLWENWTDSSKTGWLELKKSNLRKIGKPSSKPKTLGGLLYKTFEFEN
jgi:hypothetical protein